MAMIQCPECKKEISDMAVSCPNCGYTLRPALTQKLLSTVKTRFTKRMAVIAAVMAACLLIVIAALPKMRVALLPTEERWLYHAVEELRQDILNPDSLQIKQAFAAIEVPEYKENVLIISYTAQNQGGGYTAGRVSYEEDENGDRHLIHDTSDKVEYYANVDLSSLSEEEVREIGALARNAIAFDVTMQEVLMHGEEIPKENIEKVLKMF